MSWDSSQKPKTMYELANEIKKKKDAERLVKAKADKRRKQLEIARKEADIEFEKIINSDQNKDETENRQAEQMPTLSRPGFWKGKNDVKSSSKQPKAESNIIRPKFYK